ncbi:YppF family protein [Neobacillus fumarioli]|uniref:YppF family protein n=1 Tax=Neobacillus fumarioli TaxID=105229 RepID=UPI00082C7CE9|nr:YppF family protein [Neobacillus fumarioli]
MDLRELKKRFIQSRDYMTEDVNALLDFVRKAYIHNEICIKEYRLLIRELEQHGAVFPEILQENSLIEQQCKSI